jgi:hypothetical protein
MVRNEEKDPRLERKVYNKYRHWNFIIFQINYPMSKEGEGRRERGGVMLDGKGRYERVVNLLHEEEAVISKYCYMQQTHRQ